MLLLAIESSCDETAIALFEAPNRIVYHEIYSQISLHTDFGGVVPELAARDHCQKLHLMLENALLKTQYSLKDLNAICYTQGPGLIGALLVGATFAKTLAYALNIPAIGVNHLEGHLLAVMLEDKQPNFPFVALLVSGGHSMLYHVSAPGAYHLLGESLDDAAGEAFDKTAKLMGLGYPGGPAIAKLAAQATRKAFTFPIPMKQHPSLDLSFSGLKTFALQTYRECEQTQKDKEDIAYALEAAITESLILKCKKALKQTNCKNLIVAGGVSANKTLRKKLNSLGEKMNTDIFLPRIEFCTDNAAMIAVAGYHQFKQQAFDPSLEILPKPRWPLGT